MRAPWHAWLVAALGLGVAVGLALRVHARRQRAEHAATIDAAVPSAPRDGFVGSSACKACHPGAYATWHDSFHRTMTQRAEPGAVIGAFDHAPLADGTIPQRDGDAFAFVTAAGSTQPVVMTTGAHHMQVYWTPADDGSLVATRWAWLREPEHEGGRWVPNAATLVRPPGDEPAFTWNRVCIKCHAVAGAPGWDEARGVVRSQVAELGIACEACHGPGAAHASAHRNPLVRYARHLDSVDARDPWIVQPGRLSPAAASEACAQCHSITVFADEQGWLAAGRAHPIAEPASHPPLHAWARLVRHPLHEDQPWIDPVLDEEPELFAQLYWSDGMVRVSGREYGGMIESACFEGGELSCLTCHQMHGAPADDQLRPEARTDHACAGCHPTIAAAGAAHSHHPTGSVACVDCHMPHTTWGLLKAIRSHEIDVPRASVAVETGRPLACDLCHLDRSPAFSAEALARWYGHDVPAGLPADTAASAIGLLSGDAGQRALWAWHFGDASARRVGGRTWAVPILARLLADPVPAVRLVAARSLGLGPDGPDPLGAGAAARDEIARSLPPPDRRGPLVLRRPDGSLDEARIEVWARLRDDRPVLLAE